MTDVSYTPVVRMRMRRARPLIYRCVGLCHEYAKRQRRCTIDEIIPDSQVFRSCCPVGIPRGEHDGGVFQLAQLTLLCVRTDVLITSHRATPPPPPKFLAPPHCPCQSPAPSCSVSVCSLALGLEQRAIWARLPASSGGPLHRKDSFSSTSVWQHQTPSSTTPPPVSFSPLLLLHLSLSYFCHQNFPYIRQELC